MSHRKTSNFSSLADTFFANVTMEEKTLHFVPQSSYPRIRHKSSDVVSNHNIYYSQRKFKRWYLWVHKLFLNAYQTSYFSAHPTPCFCMYSLESLISLLWITIFFYLTISISTLFKKSLFSRKQSSHPQFSASSGHYDLRGVET